MDKFISWIKANNYDSFVRNHLKYFRNVLENSLNVRKEKILIVTDYGSIRKRVAPLMAYAYYSSGKKLGLDIDIVTQKVNKGEDQVGKKAKEKIYDLKNRNVIIVSCSNKLGKLDRKPFRRFCKERKHRFVSATSLGEIETRRIFSVIDAMNVDYGKLSKDAKRIKNKLDSARNVRVVTKKGTDAFFDVKGQKSIANDGDYSRESCGGNIPCGEVYIAPNNSEGKIVIDLSSRNKWGTMIVRKPVMLTIKNGFITNIEGHDEAKLLAKSINWTRSSAKKPSSMKTIGELGIGINPKAKVIGSMIVDEKIKGSAHVGIGSNFFFGGNVISTVHLDQVFNRPKIFVDGEELKV